MGTVLRGTAREACEELICQHAWEKLREHDQLLKALGYDSVSFSMQSMSPWNLVRAMDMT